MEDLWNRAKPLTNLCRGRMLNVSILIVNRVPAFEAMLGDKLECKWKPPLKDRNVTFRISIYKQINKARMLIDFLHCTGKENMNDSKCCIYYMPPESHVNKYHCIITPTMNRAVTITQCTLNWHPYTTCSCSSQQDSAKLTGEFRLDVARRILE